MHFLCIHVQCILKVDIIFCMIRKGFVVGMRKILDVLVDKVKRAFEERGFDSAYGMVTVSNRPDLCQFQCNGAMAAAKKYKQAPLKIAGDVVEYLKDDELFQEIEAMAPGFINIKLNHSFLVGYLQTMTEDKRLGFDVTQDPKLVLVDYGGANIAKPLHIGHLRSAIIGESVKRLIRYAGNEVIGDAHLGDWGLPMGLIITELKKRNPTWPYFDDNYHGEYPIDPPFTIGELEEIYPFASANSKEDPGYREEAKTATYLLQQGKRGYYALWTHILNVSMADLKKNYSSLNVNFELWKKESDVDPYIPDMVQAMKDNGYTRISDGALVVDVKEENDTKEMPPCMILKSDGAALYNTTDLATIVERMELFKPNRIIYMTDKRQELYFQQIFRCARITKLVDENTELNFLGFGTMNGKDGKPFKTRDGGVMRLEHLQQEINEEVYKKIMANREMEEQEAREIAKIVGLAALKYGDLSNQASKDYIFDIDRFASFEGDTGPYILYTMVRIKSILAKCQEKSGGSDLESLRMNVNQEGCRKRKEAELNLVLVMTKYQDMLEHAVAEMAPHKVCQYIYELANLFNSFYHENKIIAELDLEKQEEWIALIYLVLKILEKCIELLAIDAPNKM